MAGVAAGAIGPSVRANLGYDPVKDFAGITLLTNAAYYLVTPPALNVKSVKDLSNVGIVSLCGAQVPCGVYAANILQRAGVAIPESSITRGADVKTTLAAVSQGDAQAAMVYVTDVTAAGSTVQGVEIPEAENTIAVYPIAPIAGTTNARLANAFIAYVLSPAGQKILVKYGFLPPNPLAQ